VGSSREAIEVCRAVQSELNDDFDVTVWDQDVFSLSSGALDSLLQALESSDAGIFILKPDDLTTRRGVEEATARDNVVLELGMFIGRLSPSRTFMLTPSGPPLHLPSDLLGITTASYDSTRVARQGMRAAVGPACTQIRNQLKSQRGRLVSEPEARQRLDRAMARLSRDLESLLAPTTVHAPEVAEPLRCARTRIGRTLVHVESGRIENYECNDGRTAVALPANEYFDDDCVLDVHSSLGAYVRHHFGGDVEVFLSAVHAELIDLPSQRVPRAERRIDESYGVGQAIFLRHLPEHQIVIVSATTERAAIGLRAEPHFLYASMQGVIETMNANRLTSLVTPVLGAGHGGMPTIVALLFNLLALRSCLTDDIGRHIREARFVVFDRAASECSEQAVQEVLARTSTTTDAP
jgi:hypothetical protein